ncbi:MAG: hypothetical protein R2851_01740 [Caldilineaceae bacterium]
MSVDVARLVAGPGLRHAGVARPGLEPAFRAVLRQGGWITPALLLTPVLAVLVIDLVHPVYT